MTLPDETIGEMIERLRHAAQHNKWIKVRTDNLQMLFDIIEKADELLWSAHFDDLSANEVQELHDSINDFYQANARIDR